jgi:CRISPR/Cas system-associated endonuclease Cas1
MVGELPWSFITPLSVAVVSLVGSWFVYKRAGEANRVNATVSHTDITTKAFDTAKTIYESSIRELERRVKSQEDHIDKIEKQVANERSWRLELVRLLSANGIDVPSHLRAGNGVEI